MKPKTDEIWSVKLKYWPSDIERNMLVIIYYAWADGRIQFLPLNCCEGDPIWADQCAMFELIERVSV